MITTLLTTIIYYVLLGIFYFLPIVTLSDIPFIGEQIVSILTTIIGIWNSFRDTFPYAGTIWDVFLFVIIPTEIVILTLKFFLGHRAPISHN
jgi:hypothetical protein